MNPPKCLLIYLALAKIINNFQCQLTNSETKALQFGREKDMDRQTDGEKIDSEKAVATESRD